MSNELTCEEKAKLAREHQWRGWDPVAPHDIAAERFTRLFGRQPERVFDYCGITWAGPVNEAHNANRL